MEIEFRQEFGAWERAGGRRRGPSMKELGKIGQKRSKDMYDAFMGKAIFEYQDKLNLNNNQIETLYEAFNFLDYPYYKNANCLIFSYYCLDIEGEIKEKNLNFIKNNILTKKTKIKEIEDEEEEEKTKGGDVVIEDVIRYCRMWRLNKNLYKFFKESF